LACEKAVSAIDAFVGVEHDLWFQVDSLRVLAPKTVKRTTLQKNCCAYAWSVVNREPLDVEDNTLVYFRVQVFSGTIYHAEKINLHIPISSERKTAKSKKLFWLDSFLEQCQYEEDEVAKNDASSVG